MTTATTTDTLVSIIDWFKQAKPNPTAQDAATQLGCHYEEIHEMQHVLYEEIHTAEDLANMYKSGHAFVEINNHTEMLDALCDQVVTAIGTAYMLGYDIESALKEVNASNWSKFEDGKPVFDRVGKIQKGKNYFKPELTKYTNKEE